MRLRWEAGRSAVSFVLVNFTTPLVFYFTFHRWGPKTAIGFAWVVTAVQLLVQWGYRIKLSPIFIVASGFTLSFGMIDLWIPSPRFFRLEPFFQNFVIATLLLISVLTQYPVLYWFISALPAGIRPDFSRPKVQVYLKKLTGVWIIYLYLKAVLFLYLAFQVDLGSLVLLRSLIGGGTLVLLFLGDIFYRKRVLKS